MNSEQDEPHKCLQISIVGDEDVSVVFCCNNKNTNIFEMETLFEI